MAGKSYKPGQGNPRDVEQLRRFVQRELRRIGGVLGTPPNFSLTELNDVQLGPNPLLEGQGLWYDADTGQWRNRASYTESVPTGLADGGELNIVAGELEVTAGAGLVIDAYTDPLAPPKAVALMWSDVLQPITLAPPVAGSVLFVGVENSGVPIDDDIGGVPFFEGRVVQYPQRPNPTRNRQEIFLGVLIHNGAEWVEGSNPKVVNQSAETLRELLVNVLGPTFIIQGGRVDEAPSFTLSQEEGTIWEQNRNWHRDKSNPNRELLPAQNPITFRYVNRDFSFAGPAITTINANLWDDNGTVGTVPGNANTATIQRLFLDIAGNYWILLGQETYTNFDEANANLYSDNPIVPVLLENSIFLGFVVAEKAKTDWDNAEAIFIPFTTGRTIAGAGAPITEHDNLTGITPDNHHNQVHKFWGTDHSDVDAADTPTDGQVPVYRTNTGKWQAETLDLTVEWGEIGGNLQNQTDLWAELQAGKAQAIWGQIGGVLGDQTDLLNALTAAGDSAVWGNISGILANQSDLQNALNAKTNQSDFLAHTGNSSIHFTVGSIDHTLIQNRGSNTHAQIDAHIGNGNIHYGDAPADGQQYARINNNWAVVDTGPGGGFINPGVVQGDMTFWNATAEEWVPTSVIRVNGNGNVLVANRMNIGSASNPFRALLVTEPDNAEVAQFRSTASGIGMIAFAGTTTVNLPQVGASGDNLILRTSYVERMRIASGGGVMIGTAATEGQLLNVAGAVKTGVLTVDGNSNGLLATFYGNPSVAERGLTLSEFAFEGFNNTSFAFNVPTAGNTGVFQINIAGEPYLQVLKNPSRNQVLIPRGDLRGGGDTLPFELRAQTTSQYTQLFGGNDSLSARLALSGSGRGVATSVDFYWNNVLTLSHVPGGTYWHFRDSQIDYARQIVAREQSDPATQTVMNANSLRFSRNISYLDQAFNGGIIQVRMSNGGDRNVNAMRIDADGSVLIGSNDRPAASILFVTHESLGNPLFERRGNDAGGIAHSFRKARGALNAPREAVQDGDTIGGFAAWGYDGAGYAAQAQIAAVVTGPVAISDVPVSLDFRTGGTSTASNRLRIQNDGVFDFYSNSLVNVGAYEGVGNIRVDKVSPSLVLQDTANATNQCSAVASAGATSAVFTASRAGPNGSAAQIAAIGNAAYLSLSNQNSQNWQVGIQSGGILEVRRDGAVASRWLANSRMEHLFGTLYGSATAASPTDLSRHIALYGTNYGFSITGGTLNVVANSAVFAFTTSGLAMGNRRVTGLANGTAANDAVNVSQLGSILGAGLKLVASGRGTGSGQSLNPIGCTVTLQGTGLWAVTFASQGSVNNIIPICTVGDGTISQQKIYVSYNVESPTKVTFLTFDDGRARKTAAIAFAIFSRA